MLSAQTTRTDMDIIGDCLDRLFGLISLVVVLVITLQAEPLVSGTLQALAYPDNGELD